MELAILGPIVLERLNRGTFLTSISDLRKVPLLSLSRTIGPKIANSIKKQLGEDHKEIKDETQVDLSNF
jgi:hypothetical protein